MRKDVMVYYNDQIMDNLIRAKYDLPFVHVDIQSLTSAGASQITGTIGAGETQTHTDSGPIAALSMLSKAVTRPFSYSVSPQRSETLTITSAPALGSQALASPTPTPTPTKPPKPTPMPTPEVLSKVTVTTGADEEITSKTTETTLKPAPAPKSITIYNLYEDFLNTCPTCPTCPTHPLVGPIGLGSRPSQNEYVDGTLKVWHGYYYYIDKRCQRKYYNLCKSLFTKGQAGSLEKQVEITGAKVNALESQLATPESPR
jgi:hypothetical protein